MANNALSNDSKNLLKDKLDILKEKNLIVDIEEFNREMELQRDRARSSWKGSGEEKEDAQFLELKDKFGATKFLGYNDLETKAKIIIICIKLIKRQFKKYIMNS